MGYRSIGRLNLAGGQVIGMIGRAQLPAHRFGLGLVGLHLFKVYLSPG
jgi:hypothetical protein